MNDADVSASAKPRRWALRDQSRSRLQGKAAMVTDEECVDYARECVRLASLTVDQEIRDQLLNMAREWMAAAMHERHSVRSTFSVEISAASRSNATIRCPAWSTTSVSCCEFCLGACASNSGGVL